MDSHQSRRLGDPPFPSPRYPHLQQHQQHQQHFPGQQPANYPPVHHFPPYAPAPHPPQYQHHYAASPPPPYDASAPFHQHYYQYPPPGTAAAPPLSRPHHMPPLPPVPPPQPVPDDSYPPPSNQGWANQSWSQHQGLEYPDKNFPYKEDDWAAKAKAWAAAKSVTENPLMHTEAMSDGIVKGQNLYFHQQNQEKQATDLGPSSYTSGSINGHAKCNSYSVAAHNDHISPVTNYSNSFIHDQEVPYSYSSISGDTESAHRSENLQQSVSFRVQEGSFSSQSALPDYAHGENSHNIVIDKPLEFESRSASCPDVAGVMQIMNNDTMGNTVNSWAPSVVPGVYPQSLPSSGTQFNPHLASQPSLLVQHTPSFGRPSGPSTMPSVQPVSGHFVPGTGEPVNQAIGYSADASGDFGLTERPKKAAVPKWLQEEIIKSRVVIANSYTNKNGTSNGSLEDEHAAESYSEVDEDNRSTDSTKSTKDNDDDEDVVQTARSAAVNQEIKHILTEVLLKVTDELFDQIATKVLCEDDPTVEAREHKKQSVSPPSAFKPRASAEVLTSVKENSSNGDGVNYKSTSLALGGDILGLASYASDEEDDENERSRRSRSPPSGTMVQGDNHGSFSAGAKRGDNGNVNIINKAVNNEALHYETKGGHMHTNAASERCIMNDGITTSKKNTKASFDLRNGKQSTVLKDLGQPNGFVDQKESTSVGDTGEDAKDSKLTIEDNVRELKGSLSIHSYPDNKSYTNVSLSNVTANKEQKNIDSNKAKFTSSKEKKDNNSNETLGHEKNIKLKEKMEKTYSLKEKSGNRTQAGESDSRRNQSSANVARGHSTKDSNEDSREDLQKDKVKLRNEKENQTRRRTKDSEKYSSRRSPSPSNRSRHSKEISPRNQRNIMNHEPSDNSRKRKLQSQRDSSSPSPIKGRNRQLSRSPDRKHSHHRHSYSTSRRRSRSSTPGRGRR